MDKERYISRNQLLAELGEAKERVLLLEKKLRSNGEAGIDASQFVLQDKVLTTLDIVPFHCPYEPGYAFDYVGASIGEVTGFPVDRFYGDSAFWFSRIHPDDLEKVVGRFERLQHTARTRCEYRWQVADETYRWFCLSMRITRCVRDGVCISGVFWDITDRKRTERALLEREERYRTVADFTHDWEFWVGPDGAFLYVSPSFERVTGYRPDELKNDPSLLFETIVHPLDRQAVRSSLLDGVHSDESLTFDFRIVTREGDVRWIGHVSQPVYDDKGDPLGRRASNRDVTELKEAMQALRDKNQFISSIMDNAPATIFAKDVDGRYLFGNPRFMEYVEKPQDEVLGKTDYALFDTVVADLFRASDLRVLESGKPDLEELDLAFRGELEHWTTTKFPLLNAEGDPLGVCGISLNITDWRRAEARLRQLARAVEQSPVSVGMTDMNGRILSVNPYYCRVSGYSEEELVGRRIGFMLDEPDDSAMDELWASLRNGSGWHGELRNRTKSGELLWESATISPVRDSHGRTANFVVVKDDITERKRLERLEKDVERIVRHDLKSPIMSFIWVPRSLRKEENITEDQARMLHELERSAHRLLKMINLSLDIFKMEEGTYELDPEDLNILRIVQNVMRELQSIMDVRKIESRVLVSGAPATDGDFVLVRGEELLCHSMLTNLIKNAVEASSAGDAITVECHTGDRTRVSIHNPEPVPESVRQTFFDKYATSGKRFGTGLGTYSARLIAETLGGTISMESSAESGTTVTVVFPVIP